MCVKGEQDLLIPGIEKLCFKKSLNGWVEGDDDYDDGEGFSLFTFWDVGRVREAKSVKECGEKMTQNVEAKCCWKKTHFGLSGGHWILAQSFAKAENSWQDST